MITEERLKVLENAAFGVVSEIKDEDDREVALTSIVDVMGVVYKLPASELDEFQDRINKRLCEM